MPENPHILVHASKTSKIEKFSCEMMSLSILLDYRPEDSKKHNFEVSLFAELFNEMLTRDFGFNIYKAFYFAPDEQSADKDPEKNKKDKDDPIKSSNEEPKEKRSKQDNGTSSLKEKEAKDKENSNADAIETDGGRKSSKDATSRHKEKDSHKEREREREHRDRDRDRKERRISRRDEDTDDDEFSIRSGDGRRREHKKLRTEDHDLLLSFVYFDQGHCGYIFSNHIEDLFYALGLQLSRAEVKKLVGKLTPRTLLYRLVDLFRSAMVLKV